MEEGERKDNDEKPPGLLSGPTFEKGFTTTESRTAGDGEAGDTEVKDSANEDEHRKKAGYLRSVPSAKRKTSRC